MCPVHSGVGANRGSLPNPATGVLLPWNCFDDAAGVADSDGVGRDVVRDDRACSDGAVVADSDARKDSHRTAYPAVVADGDRLCPLLTGVALHGVGAVAGGVDRHIGTDESVVADGNGGFVENGAMEIGKETFAHADVLAIVAIERLIDEDLVVTGTEEGQEQLLALLEVRGLDVVVAPNQVLAGVEFVFEFGVAGVIDLPCEHFFFLSHCTNGLRAKVLLFSCSEGVEAN